jgi:hypothetical protein
MALLEHLPRQSMTHLPDAIFQYDMPAFSRLSCLNRDSEATSTTLSPTSTRQTSSSGTSQTANSNGKLETLDERAVRRRHARKNARISGHTYAFMSGKQRAAGGRGNTNTAGTTNSSSIRQQPRVNGYTGDSYTNGSSSSSALAGGSGTHHSHNDATAAAAASRTATAAAPAGGLETESCCSGRTSHTSNVSDVSGDVAGGSSARGRRLQAGGIWGNRASTTAADDDANTIATLTPAYGSSSRSGSVSNGVSCGNTQQAVRRRSQRSTASRRSSTNSVDSSSAATVAGYEYYQSRHSNGPMMHSSVDQYLTVAVPADTTDHDATAGATATGGAGVHSYDDSSAMMMITPVLPEAAARLSAVLQQASSNYSSVNSSTSSVSNANRRSVSPAHAARGRSGGRFAPVTAATLAAGMAAANSNDTASSSNSSVRQRHSGQEHEQQHEQQQQQQQQQNVLNSARSSGGRANSSSSSANGTAAATAAAAVNGSSSHRNSGYRQRGGGTRGGLDMKAALEAHRHALKAQSGSNSATVATAAAAAAVGNDALLLRHSLSRDAAARSSSPRRQQQQQQQQQHAVRKNSSSSEIRKNSDVSTDSADVAAARLSFKTKTLRPGSIPRIQQLQQQQQLQKQTLEQPDPKGPVLGVALVDTVSALPGCDVPWLLARCISYLCAQDRLDSVGLFRLAGDGRDLLVLRAAVDGAQQVCWDESEQVREREFFILSECSAKNILRRAFFEGA